MADNLKKLFERVLSDYEEASSNPNKNHPLAALIRNDFKTALELVLPDDGRYLVKGSAGQGVWGSVPWVATFDVLITRSAQEKYYVTYLFKSDMSGIYLNINQGVTDIQNRYKAGARRVLELKAADFVAQLGPLPSGYTTGRIDVGSNVPRDVDLYNYGSICAKFYPRYGIPEDDVLIRDYKEILLLYGYLVDNDTSIIPEEADNNVPVGFEDTTRKVKHERIDRNRKLSKDAKKFHGYKCQICSFEYKTTYGALGEGFIEAHHLVPLSQLKNQKVPLDPKVDFAVLCANCHRMAHKLEDPSNLEPLRILFAKK